MTKVLIFFDFFSTIQKIQKKGGKNARKSK